MREKIATLAFCLLAPFLFNSCGSENTKTEQTADTPKTETTPQKHEPVAEYHYGIDVSHWDGNIVEDINKLDKLSFAICKATEGHSYVDPDFHKNRMALQEKGLIYGSYHFFVIQDNPVKQAEHYYKIIGGDHHGKQMPCIVDIEQGSLGDNTNSENIQESLQTFLNHIEKLSGRVPMIYTNIVFANEHLTDPVFAKYPLWLAEYNGMKSPTIPDVWKEKGYTIWQKTDHHDINSTEVDYDQFYGLLSTLSAK